MTCMEAQKLIKPYLEQTLSDKELEGFLSHVENCPDCYDELEIYLAIFETLEDRADNSGPDEYNFKLKLKNRIRDSWKYLRVCRAQRIFRWSLLAAAELFLALAVFTGVEMLRDGATEKTTLYRVIYGTDGDRHVIGGENDFDETLVEQLQSEAGITESPAERQTEQNTVVSGKTDQ